MPNVYTQGEDGDLILVGDGGDEVTDPAELVEALLEQNPDVEGDEFIVADPVLVTLVRRAVVSENGDEPQAAPKRRGRPPGSKNKTKAVATKGKAKRGRPKGSGKKKAKGIKRNASSDE